MGIYILLRAVDRFAANYNSFSGQFDSAMDKNISPPSGIFVTPNADTL